jgi:ADP-ribose pyrophosphatase YjhB (NUDIX family)
VFGIAMKKNISDKNSEKKTFLVNVLGIIFDTSRRKILIGKRESDSEVPEIKWSFIGGRVESDEDMERFLERKIKSKTGYDVKSLGPVFSRIPKEKSNLLLIYYLCELVGGKEKIFGDFSELKWADPEDLERYFITSFDSRLKEYILNLK